MTNMDNKKIIILIWANKWLYNIRLKNKILRNRQSESKREPIDKIMSLIKIYL